MEQLCQRIGMPQEAAREVLLLHHRADFRPDLGGLTRQDRWTEGLAGLRAALGEDSGGFKTLCCMLRCALAARGEYQRLGLPEEVYYDTMGCFSRFVREHRETHGRYGFDRGWWTVRQVSCKLFRIGQLEYELVTEEGGRAISLHIPSDARLETPLLRESCLQARGLLGRAFPEYGAAPMVCRSWLLSPALKELLPPRSNILAFQRSFDITPAGPSGRSVLLWVFKNPDLSPEDFPEDTSLQRRLKEFLLGGGVFPEGRGVLVPEPFLPNSTGFN